MSNAIAHSVAKPTSSTFDTIIAGEKYHSDYNGLAQYFSRTALSKNLYLLVNQIFMHKLLLLFALLIIGHSAILGQVTFQKSYGTPSIQSEAYDIIECPGGYLIAGFTVNATTGRDGLLMRLDLQGNVVWEKAFDQSNYDEFKAAVLTSDGGFIAIGNTRQSTAGNDAWVVKVSADGTLLWQKQFNRPNSGLDGIRILEYLGTYLISGSISFANGSSTFVARIDNNGSTLWSKNYDAPNSLMTASYITDSLLYLGGLSNFDGAIMAIAPQTGEIVKRFSYQAPGTETLDFIAPASDGNLVVSDFAQPFWPSSKLYTWIQKITPSGNVIWSKIYDFNDQQQYNGPLISTIDGGFLLCPGNGSNDPNLDAHMMKIDGDGQVLWCNAFGKPNGQDWFLRVIQTMDGGFIAAGLTANGAPGKTNVFVVKTDAQGRLAGCCPSPKAVQALDFTTTFSTASYGSGAFSNGFQAFGVDILSNHPTQTHACNQVQPTLSTEIALCPGETIDLGGQTYTQPDTVTLEVPSASGTCDTLLTYTLTNALEGQNSQVSIQCPADIALIIPEGSASALVNYTQPTAVSDCSCPGLDLTKISGGDSGSNFPIGNNTVCWMAMDACGGTQSCCFNVSITEEADACDVKTTPCLKWELVSIKRDASSQRYYTIRLTNTCASKLTYAYIGLPTGMMALSPANNSVYTTTSGNEYEVRNPNYSPVYGIRFKPKTGSLSSGQSEVFRFSLPQQVSFDYLYVAGRLENAAFYEAHLNTFGCPIGTETNASDRNSALEKAGSALTLVPNPAQSGTQLELLGGRVSKGVLLLDHISGQNAFQGAITENQVFMGQNELPEGVYIFRVVENGVVLKIGKLVVIR